MPKRITLSLHCKRILTVRVRTHTLIYQTNACVVHIVSIGSPSRTCIGMHRNLQDNSSQSNQLSIPVVSGTHVNAPRLRGGILFPFIENRNGHASPLHSCVFSLQCNAPCLLVLGLIRNRYIERIRHSVQVQRGNAQQSAGTRPFSHARYMTRACAERR